MIRTAVVAGAGPAGLSAAMGLLKAGVNVTVLEKRMKWTDRVCGSFLNAEAVQHLHWLGVLDESDADTFTQIPEARLHTWRGFSLKYPTERNHWKAMSTPRKDLEERLQSAARAQGADIQWGSRLLNAEKTGTRWKLNWRTAEGKEMETTPDLFIRAEGRSAKGDHGWYGWHATFEGAEAKPGDMSLHFFPGGYVGLLTLKDGTTNACGLSLENEESRGPWQRVFEKALSYEPQLNAIMGPAVKKTEWQGVGPLPYTLGMRPGHGAILAGDAAAVGDPFMGEGIGRALSAGPMLYKTLEQVPLGGSTETIIHIYESLWRQSYGWRFRLGFSFRLLLRGSAASNWGQDWIFRQPAMIQASLPVFHEGFKNL